jgi:hypothetical protein
MVPDEARSEFISRDIHINKSNQIIQREIELTYFEVAKVIYLRECSTDFF